MKRDTRASLTTEGGDRCPVCGQRASQAAQFPDYELFSCPLCGCWSSTALFRGAVTSFETVNYFANADLDRPKWEALFRKLKREGPQIRSVLDVGCGNGAFLSYVSAEHPQIRCEGIEIDSDRAAEARTRLPGARIHIGDAEATLSGNALKPFDLITLWDVFEHVTAPVQLLSQLSRHLAPGGIIHIVTINEQSIIPMLGRFSHWLTLGRVTYPIRRTHEAHHLTFFTREGLDIAAAETGLKVRELWFDRLRRGRMDGPALVTAATTALLRIENVLGNGLFVNLILEASDK